MGFEHRETARAMRASYESAASGNGQNGLKILFLALTVDVGAFQGDSTHVVELVSNLRALGYGVRWIARRSEGRKMWPDPQFHCVGQTPKPGSDVLRLLQLLPSILKGAWYVFRHAGEADIIYCRDRLSMLLVFLPARLG